MDDELSIWSPLFFPRVGKATRRNTVHSKSKSIKMDDEEDYGSGKSEIIIINIHCNKPSEVCSIC